MFDVPASAETVPFTAWTPHRSADSPPPAVANPTAELPASGTRRPLALTDDGASNGATETAENVSAETYAAGFGAGVSSETSAAASGRNVSAETSAGASKQSVSAVTSTAASEPDVSAETLSVARPDRTPLKPLRVRRAGGSAGVADTADTVGCLLRKNGVAI